MPLTFAHPIMVAPLRRTEMVMPALIVGSMVPDINHFIPALPWSHYFSHSLTGMFTVDLFCGLLLLAIWQLLVFPTYDAAMPASWHRWSTPRRPDRRWWIWSVPSLLIGILTHLGLDAYTHFDSELVLALPFMAHRIGGWKLSLWIQIVASAAGVLGVLWWCRREWLAAVPTALPAQASRAARIVLWGVPLMTGAVATAVNLIWLWWNFGAGVTFRSYAVAVTVVGGRWAMIAVLLVSAAWRSRLWLAAHAEWAERR